jgi:formylglycine-generating enzyme required for sulfatase activity
MRRDRVLAFATGAAVVLVVIALARRHRPEDARCGSGFVASGARCLPTECPAPLARGPSGCAAPEARVTIPATKLTIGPSDWEAQGRVTPRTLAVAPFAIDAFEITVPADPTRAASGLSYDEAARVCASRGGRLPTEDEWIAAAAGERGMRYPWGETGAVCRRAAWGLANGPCATTGDGPDTVGAHASGDTPRGVHDLAGNVAEWVAAPEGASVAVVRGGSWRTSLAADLRTWARRELPKSTRADDIGARCAYDATPSAR